MMLRAQRQSVYSRPARLATSSRVQWYCACAAAALSLRWPAEVCSARTVCVMVAWPQLSSHVVFPPVFW